MHKFYRGEFFNFEVIRILGTTCYGGAEVAEFLEAVGKIRNNDPESWHKAWVEQAEIAEEIAREAELKGHCEAAKRAFLRASNYTRASAYMMTGDRLGKSDPRTAGILSRAQSLFHTALGMFENPVHRLRIPYGQGVHLPAYLYLPTASRRIAGKIPLVVNFIGADSIQEEIFYMFPAAGPELGYAVLTFEGPGQGLMLHEHGVPMRPDWEEVNSIAMDYIFQYSKINNLDLDVDRVAVAGASLAGYFALRAAADQRYRACVAVDPIYDLWEFAAKRAGPTFFNLWKQGWVSDWFMNSVVSIGTQLIWQMRWEIFTSARFLGALSPVEILRTMQKFTLNGYLDRIKCPVLVTGGADTLYTDAQGDTTKVFSQLQGLDKELWVGSTPGSGSLQAKMGALGYCNQRVFSFLDKQFNINRTQGN